MTINQHKISYAGYPIQDWNDAPLTSPTTTAYRITVEPESEEWSEKFARFLQTTACDQVRALVIGGAWDDYIVSVEQMVDQLVDARERLPNLRALFLPDVVSEECEISWIEQTDISPILEAYPQLEHFGTRGSEGLHFRRFRSTSLRSWLIETGGIKRSVIAEIRQADVPNLLDFELWTGSRRYNWDGTIEDVLPILRGEVFPRLTRLGMLNSEIADEIAIALAESPLYPQLEHLDLSLGLLGDAGASALLRHPHTKRLKSLDVRHHFCTPPVEAQLYGLLGDGVKLMIDASEGERDWDDDNRYVAVGE